MLVDTYMLNVYVPMVCSTVYIRMYIQYVYTMNSR